MSCLGVHFALTEQDVEGLLAAKTDEDRLRHVRELEERYFKHCESYIAESDKAWDAMHRALGDSLLSYDGGEYPLNHAVLGGQPLYSEDDYIMSLKTPAQVVDVSERLALMTEDQFKTLYWAIDPDEYEEDLSDEDFEYTWEWLQGVRELFALAAKERRYVLFTADQ